MGGCPLFSPCRYTAARGGVAGPETTYGWAGVPGARRARPARYNNLCMNFLKENRKAFGARLKD